MEKHKIKRLIIIILGILISMLGLSLIIDNIPEQKDNKEDMYQLVNQQDVENLKQMILDKDYTTFELYVYDINDDGILDIEDLLMFQKINLGEND